MKLGYMTSSFGDWLLVSKNPFPAEKSNVPFVSLRPGPPLAEVLPLLAEIGYDEVTICTWVGQEAFPLSLSENRVHKIRRLVDGLGLQITALGSHGGSNHIFDRHGYLTEDKDELAARLRYTKLCIDLAVRWGVSVVEDMAGDIPEGMSKSEAWKRAKDVYQELAAYSEQNGVCLAVEPFFGLIESPDDFVRLHREVGSTALGCVLDIQNLAVAGYPSIGDAIDKLGPYLAHAHTKGLAKYGSTVPGAADDTIDQQHYVRRLVEVGYKGPLTLEEYPDRYSPPLEASTSARIAFENISEILNQAEL
jgi:sugar phosphate isomerase/epimerase